MINQLVQPVAEPSVEWLTLWPIILVLGGGVLAVLAEAFVPARLRRGVAIGIGVTATLGSLLVLVYMWGNLPEEPQFAGEIIFDAQSVIVQGILAVLGFMSILVMADRTALKDGSFAGQPSDRPGSHEEALTDEKGYQRTEIFALMLLSLGGMMVFPVVNSFIGMFVALEVMSLPLYILAATARRRRQLSQESALKYFILGAFASGFFLMGMAFIYGTTGRLNVHEITGILVQLRQAGDVPVAYGMNLMLMAGVFMVMVGLLFKIGAAPFHAWTPDVYTGAPTPVTGFMAAAVKVAAFGAILRFYQMVGAVAHETLLPMYSVIILLTMAVGTFAGLLQRDIKRMLAYSSIAHAGYILLGVMSVSMLGVFDTYFYLLAYGLSTVGAFALIPLVRSADKDGNVTGEATDFTRWAGLGRKHPFFGAAMTLFLLSFAGIPLTSGFIGKFLLFKDAYSAGLGWLVIAALISSAITAFFYFRVIRVMYFEEPVDEVIVVDPEGYSTVAVVMAVLGTVVLGLFPGLVLTMIS